MEKQVSNISVIQAMIMSSSKSELAHKLFLRCSSPPSRTVASRISQTEKPPSAPSHMGCEQGGLPKIDMNTKGEER